MRKILATLLLLFWPGLLLKPSLGQRSVFFSQNVPVSSSGGSMPTTGSLGEFYPGGTTGAVSCSSGGTAVTTIHDNLGSSASFALGSSSAAVDCFTGGANGQPFLRFSGTQYMMAGTDIPCSSPCAVYMVVRPSVVGASNAVLGSTISDGALAYQISTSNVQNLDQQNVASIGSSNTALSVGTWYELAFVYSGGTVTFYINGVADGSGATSATLDTGINTLGGLGNQNPPTYLGNFDLGEIYFSNIGTYQSSAHAVLNSRFGI